MDISKKRGKKACKVKKEKEKRGLTWNEVAVGGMLLTALKYR